MTLTGSLLKRLPLSTATIYLFTGMALGPAGIGLLALDVRADAPPLQRITELAVLISLFSVGLKMRAPFSDPRWRISVRLALSGMLLTIAALTLVGILVLGLDLAVSLLFAAILAPTDPVLASDVQVASAGDPDRVRFALTGEAGLNDGIALPFVLLALGLLGQHPLGLLGSRWLAEDLLWSLAVGVGSGWLLGTMTGHVILYLRRSHRAAVGQEEFIALGLMALAYGLTLVCHGNGFLAVFAAGVALRRIEHRSSGAVLPDGMVGMTKAGHEEEVATDPQKAPAYMMRAVLGFNEQLERVAEVCVVMLLGGMLSWQDISLPTLGASALLFLVIRPLVVLRLLRGIALSRLQNGLLAWFGVRGIGSLYYLCFAAQHAASPALTLSLAPPVISVIAISIVVHGVSATPLMALYGRLQRQRPRP